MAARGPEARLLARVDADLARAFLDRDAAVLAFSGGLASLIVAALARKRGEVRGLVVGPPHAADVLAALVARDFLDYPVDVLSPSVPGVLRAARTIVSANPGLTVPEALSLVPLVLAERYCPGEIVLSGFGLSPRSPAVRRHLFAVPALSPGLGRRGASPPRSLVLRAARELGIPEGFASASRRTPVEGSGIGPALRAAGHARHLSVERLVARVI